MSKNELTWINPLDIFIKNRRFDLIFKYLYLKNIDSCQSGFYKDVYIEHIRAFNNFHEDNPSDGIPKESSEDFIKAFDNIYSDIKANGFNYQKSVITLDVNGELTDASHRLTSCCVLNKKVAAVYDTQIAEEYYDYKFFKNRGLDKSVADLGVLEYIKLNSNAYIVNLHSVNDTKNDGKVEDILNKYGFIYYKKDIHLTFNGYVNLKKLSYGFDDEEGNVSWIGDIKNKYAGAQDHAQKSMGKNPLRVFVFVCESLNKVIEAKAEIRKLYNIGNYSVHINDTREEAIELAQTYFNENSLSILNSRPFDYEDYEFDKLIKKLKKICEEKNVNIEEICASGSTPFDVIGIRKSSDLDFLYCGTKEFETNDYLISNHDSELSYYPYDKYDIINNPLHHFYYKGLKFISLNVLYLMKQKRNEIPKDVNDCKLIENFKKNKLKLGFIDKKNKIKIFKKVRNENERKIYLFGIKIWSYNKKNNEDIFWGDFSSWKEATNISLGYNDSNILDKTLSSVLKVKCGEAIFERDSVIFDKIQYSYPLLSCLFKIATENNNELNVLDFGGALGSHYFQNKEFLKPIKIKNWSVVEQQHYVKVGNEQIADEILNFKNTIDEVENSNLFLASSVIQYLENPYEWVEKFIEKGTEYILFDRTAISLENKDRLTIQNVPAYIYKASYPAWFLNEEKILSCFKDKYELILDFENTIDIVANIPSVYKGYLFKKVKYA